VVAEHHFDGILPYVDPVSFAAASPPPPGRSARLRGGADVAAPSDPLREQMAVIDNISKAGWWWPGPRHRYNILRLPGLRHRSGRSLRALARPRTS